MTNNRRIISALGLAASAFLAISASPATAQSHTSDSLTYIATERITQPNGSAFSTPVTTRAIGRVEMWTDSNYGGSNVMVEAGASRSWLPFQYNDQLSSIQNFQDIPYCFYSDNDYTGNWVYVPSGFQFANLQDFGMNDVISSFKPAPNPNDGGC